LGLAVLLAALAGFALFALAYEHDPVATADSEVADWVAASMPTWAEWLARPFSWVGGWIGALAVMVALVVVLSASRRATDAIWAAGIIGGIHFVVTPLVKEIFDRPRPTAGSAVPLPSSDSFPSGHASGAAATCTLLALLALERWPERGAVLWVSAAASVLAIGSSRVVLNVHFASDVLAGWCLGLAWLAAALLLRARAA
jgi:membrane-associated phospholipid phosphatase